MSTAASLPIRTGPEEAAAVEATGRLPLLFLLASAVVWLLLACVLGLLAAVQAHTPEFLADCPVLTHGRVQALQETAFVFGWSANAGLAIVLWILGRLSGEPLRAGNWAAIGAAFWNFGVTLGLVGIALGDVSALPLPRYVLPILLASYGAIGVPGILAWAARRRELMFASHWYAVAALFLFPWLFSCAQVMLVWLPVHGVLQAVVGDWFAQGLWSYWLAPLALAGAYYVVPRVTGRVLPSYDVAALGFWCLIFVGGWTAGRRLVGGPVPAWIATVAIVACAVLLFHYLVVALNLRPALARNPALRFVAFGLRAYVLGGLIDVVTSFRGVAAVTQFTYFDQAEHQLALYGAASMLFFGAIAFALPRLTGRPWASGRLLCGHFALAALGVALSVGGLVGAGCGQGIDLGDAAVPFGDIAGHVRPWLLVATAGQAAFLLAALLFAVNFFRSVRLPLTLLKEEEEALA